MCGVRYCYLSVLFLLLASASTASGWSSRTHTFIAQEAGLRNPELACLPDVTREENESLFGRFHSHNAAPGTIVTPDYIDQYPISVGRYVKVGSPDSNSIRIRVPHPCGVLYWKILETYQHMKKIRGLEYEYDLYTIVHYVGDLSQPLHNFPRGSYPASDGMVYTEEGSWSSSHHFEFDAVLDSSLPLNDKGEKAFQAMIERTPLTSVEDLKRQICRIANSSILLANRCYTEKRTMTRDEALKQLAMSVSLLKGIMRTTGNKIEKTPKIVLSNAGNLSLIPLSTFILMLVIPAFVAGRAIKLPFLRSFPALKNMAAKWFRKMVK